jgi:hypothetical protein
MVGPGQSYRQMITGDYINGREERAAESPDSSEMF